MKWDVAGARASLRRVVTGVAGPLREGYRTLRWYHRAWFLAVFLGSLGYLVMIPPFQTNDEPSHWHRVWSTASGHLTCGQIPKVIPDAIAAANYYGVRDRHERFHFRQWDAMRALVGANKTTASHGNACVYIPIAYVLPAAAMIPWVEPYDARAGAGMLQAFYAARATNWLTMGAFVLLFLLLVPELRNLALVFYSFPTTIQQTVSLNQEATILGCVFMLVIVWFRTPTLATALASLAIVTALSGMKAIHLVLLLLWACLLLRWRAAANVPNRQFRAVAALGLIPVVIQMLWSRLVVAVSGEDFLPGWGVSPSGQVAFLREHPFHLIVVMLKGHIDLFGRGHMNGGWTGVLGVLGWADFEIGNRGYLLLWLALLLALLGDLAAPPRRLERPAASRVWIQVVLPIVSAYLTIPAVILAMYMVFTAVGAESAIGVQGRYLLLPYFLMITFALYWARERWDAHAFMSRLRRARAPLAVVSGVCCVIAMHDGFRAILKTYY